MALPATEDFAGTGALSANWDTHGVAPSRASGVCQFNAGATAGARWTADSFNADHYSQFVCTTLSSIGPTVSQPSDTQFYVVDCQTTGSNVKIYYFNSPTYNLVATPGVAFANGNTAKLEIIGTTLTVYKNGSSIGTGTDSNLAAGMPGIWGFSATAQADDWIGDNATAAAASHNILLLLGVG